MERKIEIVIITGYLGAGKTTLLNKLIQSFGHRQIGLLVNDFGKVPVDGTLIQNSFEDMENNKIYEIGNGSIFCSCLTSSFVFGLKFFMRQKPEILFIETSGMSDPGSMARLLGEYQLRDAFQIRHVLAVVDSPSVLKMRANLTFVDKQIEASNTVLLNKADLMEEEKMKEVEDTVRAVNEKAAINRTSFCEYDFTKIGFEEFLPDNHAQSCNTKSTAPGTMFLPQYDVPEGAFISFLQKLSAKTLRLKGFYELDGAVRYFSNNNGSVEINSVKEMKNRNRGITLIYEKQFEELIKEDWVKFRKDFTR